MKIKVPQTLNRGGTAIVSEDGTLTLSISSDEPYERYDFWNDRSYMEVLDHSPEGVDLSRLKNGAALLYNHDRNVMLGTLSEPECKDGRCYVKAKISAAPDCESFRVKIKEGILKDTSIGYALKDEGEEIGKTKEGIPILKFKFSIHEASLVTIPADPSVGVGRQRSKPDGEPREIEISSKNNLDETRRNENNDSQQRESRKTEKPNMAEDTTQLDAQKLEVVREEAEKGATAKQLKRIAAIQELSKHFAEKGLGGRQIDTSELANEYIRDGKSLEDFQNAVVRGTDFKPVRVVTEDDAKVGMGEKDLEQYSIVRAINRLATKQPLDGVEKAAHDAHVKLTGREAQGMGFFIPHDVMSHRRGGMPSQIRALFTNVYSAAGALVSDDLLAGSMIELLRNKLAVVRMGARLLTGLVGNVQIPLQSGGATASWLAENATISESNQTVGQLALVPHRLGASTAFTNQLLAQSSIDIENFVREDLMRVLALAKDLAAIAGTGVSGQPLGILNTSNLSTSVTFANAQTMLYADALAFENNVALQNADLGKLGYLTTPTVRKNAKATAEISAANSTPIWKDDRVNGFTAFATNQVPTATSVIFGNWDDLILAAWAGNQVIVDPYSLSLQGQVRVVMQELCDNGLRHSKSFSVSTN